MPYEYEDDDHRVIYKHIAVMWKNKTHILYNIHFHILEYHVQFKSILLNTEMEQISLSRHFILFFSFVNLPPTM